MVFGEPAAPGSGGLLFAVPGSAGVALPGSAGVGFAAAAAPGRGGLGDLACGDAAGSEGFFFFADGEPAPGSAGVALPGSAGVGLAGRAAAAAPGRGGFGLVEPGSAGFVFGDVFALGDPPDPGSSGVAFSWRGPIDLCQRPCSIRINVWARRRQGT